MRTQACCHMRACTLQRPRAPGRGHGPECGTRRARWHSCVSPRAGPMSGPIHAPGTAAAPRRDRGQWRGCGLHPGPIELQPAMGRTRQPAGMRSQRQVLVSAESRSLPACAQWSWIRQPIDVASRLSVHAMPACDPGGPAVIQIRPPAHCPCCWLPRRSLSMRLR